MKQEKQSLSHKGKKVCAIGWKKEFEIQTKFCWTNSFFFFKNIEVEKSRKLDFQRKFIRNVLKFVLILVHLKWDNFSNKYVTNMRGNIILGWKKYTKQQENEYKTMCFMVYLVELPYFSLRASLLVHIHTFCVFFFVCERSQ